NFVTARLVDANSKFLLLFNILEVCMSGFSPSYGKFSLAITEKERTERYQEAYDILRKTVVIEEEKDFKNSWNNVVRNLVNKPMTNPMIQFLKLNGIPVDELKIPMTTMKRIRGSIVHGSFDKYKVQE